MTTEELIKLWVCKKLSLDPKTVREAYISTQRVEGSTDINSDDFSTFAGSEIYFATAVTYDGYFKNEYLWDENPIPEIIKFSKTLKEDIEVEEDPDAALRIALESEL